MSLKSATSFLLRLAIRAVLLLLFVGLPAGLFYLNGVGVTGPWTREISRALSSANFQVQVGRLTLNPFEGISAHDLEIYNAGGLRLAKVSRVLVGLNLSELIRRRVQIETMELVRADLSIPASGGPPLAVTNVRGHLRVSPTQVSVTEFGFKLAGIQFFVHGTMRRDRQPAARPWSNLPVARPGGAPNPLVEQIRRVAQEISFGATSPQIHLELAGSGSSPDEIEAPRILAEFPEIRWKNLQFKQARLEAAYAGGIFTVKSLSAEDAHGQINTAFTVDLRQKILRADLLSSIDPAPLLAAFSQSEWSREIVFHQPPRLNLELTLDYDKPSPEWLVNGGIDIENFRVKGVPFDRVNGDFTYRQGQFLTRDLNLQAPNLDLRMDLMADARTARVRVDGSVDPLPLQPLLGAGLGVIFGQMQFAERGQVRFEGEIPRANPGNLTGSGTLRLGKTAMRGAWIDSGKAEVEMKDRAVFYRHLEVRRGKGVGTGNFIYDFGGKQVRLENIRSTLNPQEIMLWVDAGIAKTVAAYRFKANPAATADGTVDMAHPERSTLDISVQAPAGLDYDLLGKTLSFGATNGALRLRGPMIYADIKSARLFGGTVALTAEVPVTRDLKKYRVSVQANHVNFPALTRLYFNYANSEGWMSGRFSFEAPLADSRSLAGKGNIRIEEGHVFGIPIFGPFSGILNGIIAGAGYQTARKATADFTIADQIIHTGNLEIQGQGFSMFGEGDIHFVTDKMDMSMRINAQGVPGIVLFPVSKLFEYVSYGTISDPVWRPKNVPRQLFGDPAPKEEANRREPANKPPGR
ncbi:MAG TPA: AsmA-like C-terminal region-containing protein [Chthoniobacterales bacterium]